MKKIVALILVAITCLSLYACKSDAAKACEALINQIGTLTLDSEQAIIDAETAYNALTAEEKEQITESGTKLKNYRDDYNNNFKPIKSAMVAIDAIGDITASSGEKITVAQELYDKLSDSQKQQINDYGDKLKKATSDFNVADTLKSINDIGTVTIDFDCMTRIVAAASRYDKLSNDEKASITNADKLDSAINEYTNLIDAEEQKLIKNFNIDTDEFNGIHSIQHKNEPYTLSNYVFPYICTTDDSSVPMLILMYNYYGDYWIFWEEAILLVDGERYTVSPGYSNVVRDNGYGSVWEFYVQTNPDIEMLKKIAYSNETNVRLHGDRREDFTFKQSHKDALKDVLAYYDILQNKALFNATIDTLNY